MQEGETLAGSRAWRGSARSAPRAGVGPPKCHSAIPRGDVSVTSRATVDGTGLHWLATSGQP